MLVGAEVIEATSAAYPRAPACPWPSGCSPPSTAGERPAATSAASRPPRSRPRRRGLAELDLRVDDHAEPVAELRRLYEVSLERFQPFVACLPGRHDAAGLIDRDEIEARIAAFPAGRALGAPADSPPIPSPSTAPPASP